MEDVVKLDLTPENLARVLRGMADEERAAGRSKLPVMNVLRDKIDRGQLPASREELLDFIGIISDYYTSSGRVSAFAEMAVMVEELLNKLEMQNDDGEVRS
jgi:hypothetical protein